MTNAFWDQEASARRDTHSLLEAMHRVAGGRKGMAGWGQITDGWRQEFLANLHANKVRRCPHAGQPISCVVNAWDLHVLRCVTCNERAMRAGEVDTDDGECDGCGRQVGQIYITPTACQAGPLAFIGGLCDTCLAIEHATGGDLA